MIDLASEGIVLCRETHEVGARSNEGACSCGVACMDNIAKSTSGAEILEDESAAVIKWLVYYTTC